MNFKFINLRNKSNQAMGLSYDGMWVTSRHLNVSKNATVKIKKTLCA